MSSLLARALPRTARVGGPLLLRRPPLASVAPIRLSSQASNQAHPPPPHPPKSATATPATNTPNHVFDHTPKAPSLSGKCACGSVGWTAKGPSSINFVCHCSICRKASGQPSLPAAAFKPNQVTWTNESALSAELPPNSRNTRYYCKSCRTYMGEDATRPLGVIALPLARAHGTPDDCYKPNHHIFYADRVEDAQDTLPKWVTLPEGEPVKQTPLPSTHTCDANYDPVSGRFRKDVRPFAPTRAPDSSVYHFVESDPIPNHITVVSPEKVQQRVARKYFPSPGSFQKPSRTSRDVIIVGGGHNGLVSAAYLARQGLDVLVLERRHVIGGAAVTEELYPGFKFSRASYLAGLLRPSIISELGLEKYGFEYLPRDPSSFTPSHVDGPLKGKSLLLGASEAATHASIAQFSVKDADNFPRYEEFLGSVREMVQPLLDGPPPDIFNAQNSKERLNIARQLKDLAQAAYRNREHIVPFYELFTAPASHILDRWFESEILKTTLATDAVIGAMTSPTHAGSAYVLLHHVMGEAAGRKGVWAYVRGGMGTVSRTIAASAAEAGAEIAVNATVKSITYKDGKATGVEMQDGQRLEAKAVLSNATPYHTFLELLPGLARDSGFAGEESPLPRDFQHHVRFADYGCGAFKINCAVDKLPEFTCMPSNPPGQPGPQHRGTVHFETTMEEIETAYREASLGMPATRPVVEMTIPSALDNTLAPPGKHVVQLFVQFAPYDVHPKIGHWADPAFKAAFVHRVFSIVEEHCPGFTSSVLYHDALSPLDLERIFGLHKGNIMHGALGLHQLGYSRPAPGFASHRTPLKGLYLCGAGAHPGGGVMGAAGRNCAQVVLSDFGK